LQPRIRKSSGKDRVEDPNKTKGGNLMKMLPLGAAALAALLAGCAASPELVSCLQPNRRVAVEISGSKVKPPAKPGAKPGRDNVLLKSMAQGDGAWDEDSAVLKAGGKADLKKLVTLVNKGTKRDTRPVNVGSVIISGHTDRLEAEDHANLDEQRALAVKTYLAEQGMDPKLMFWEGKDAKEPMAVTKFCAD
jgi:outer membrane protein OmpA-like peptidoglycan-associated protein